MKISIVSSISFYSAIRRVFPLSKFDNDRIYLSPRAGAVDIFCGDPGLAIAKTSIPAICEGRLFPFWVSLPKLNSFLSVTNGTDAVEMSIVKKMILKCGVQKLNLPIEDDENCLLKIESGGEKICTLTPAQFKNLALASVVAKDDRTSLFSGVFFSSDGKYIRTISTDSYGVAYAWQEAESNFVGHFLISAVVFSLLSSRIWEESVSISVLDNSILFESNSVSILSTQMNLVEEFPAKVIVEHLSSEVKNAVWLESEDLLTKLKACVSIKYQSEFKKSVTVARVDFLVDSESARIETSENEEKMSLSLLGKSFPSESVSFTLNGSFVSLASGILSKLPDSNYIIVGESGSHTNWVTFRGVNSQLIFGFAKLIRI